MNGFWMMTKSPPPDDGAEDFFRGSASKIIKRAEISSFVFYCFFLFLTVVYLLFLVV